MTHSYSFFFFPLLETEACAWPPVCLWGQYCRESTRSMRGKGSLLLLFQSVDNLLTPRVQKKHLRWRSTSSHGSFLPSESGCRVTEHRVHHMCPWQWLLPMCELNNQTLSRHPRSDGDGETLHRHACKLLRASGPLKNRIDQIKFDHEVSTIIKRLTFDSKPRVSNNWAVEPRKDV